MCLKSLKRSENFLILTIQFKSVIPLCTLFTLLGADRRRDAVMSTTKYYNSTQKLQWLRK